MLTRTEHDMTARTQAHWPLLPSLTAYALDGLAHALDNVVFEYSDERHSELAGVTVAIQVFAAELGHFFGGQKGEAERMLAAVEDEWMKCGGQHDDDL